MKNYLLITFLCFSVSLFGQRMEFFQGLHTTKFFNSDNYSRFNTNYSSSKGYTLGFAYHSPKTKRMSWRMAVGFQKYSSDFRASDGGHGGGFIVQAKIEKSVLSFSLFPLNLSLWNRLHLNLGVALSFTVANSYDGTRNHYVINPSSNTIDDLHDIYVSYNSFGHFGLTGRVAYDIKLSDKYTLTPQYAYYQGLTSEFTHFPKEARTRRHYYCLGFGWRI